MDKRELVEAIHGRLDGGVTRRSIEAMLHAMVGAIGEALANGERITVTGFGTFEPRHRAARMARNPRTGEPAPVEAATVPTFRPGQALRDVVREGAGKPAAKATAKKASTAANAAAKRSTGKG